MCAVVKTKLQKRLIDPEHSFGEDSSNHIKTVARILIALQNRSKSTGFKEDAQKPTNIHHINSVSFSPQDFESFDTKHASFLRLFRMTDEFLEIKKKGIAVFQDPSAFRRKYFETTPIFVSSQGPYVKFYSYQGETSKTRMLVKTTVLDPYDQDSFSTFINSAIEGNSLQQKQNVAFSDENNFTPSSQHQKISFDLFPRPIKAAFFLSKRPEFWKRKVVLCQLFDPGLYTLDQLLIAIPQNGTYFSAETITFIAVEIIKLVEELNVARSVLKTGSEPGESLEVLRPGNFCINRDGEIKLIPWDIVTASNKPFHYSKEAIGKIGRDRLRISVMLVLLFLLELLDPSDVLHQLVSKLRFDFTHKNFFSHEVFYQLMDCLESDNSKGFDKLRAIYKFMFKDLGEIKSLRTIINFLRVKSRSPEHEALLVSLGSFVNKQRQVDSDKSFAWIKNFHQSDLCYLLEDYQEGVALLGVSMGMYKDFKMDSPNDRNLCEILLLLSSYLFQEQDFKSGIHYLKEASKLKGHMEGSATYSLMKMQLYVLSLKHLRNSTDQHNILMNILRGFLNKTKDKNALRLIVTFINEELTKEYAQKLTGHLGSLMTDSNVINPTKSLELERAIRGVSQEPKYKARDKTPQEFVTTSLHLKPKAEYKFSQIIEDNDYVSLLLNSDQYFEQPELLPKHIPFFEQLLSPYFVTSLVKSVAYSKLLNQLIFHYYDLGNNQKLTELISRILESLEAKADPFDFDLIYSDSRSIIGHFFLNLLVLNDTTKAYPLSDQWLSENLSRLSVSDEEQFFVSVQRFLIRHYLGKGELFLATITIDRLINYLDSHKNSLQDTSELLELKTVKAEITKSLSANFN